MTGSFRWRAVCTGVVLLATLIGAGLTRADPPGSFQPVGKMTEARRAPEAALLLDGSVLVTGGFQWLDGEFVVTDSAERFDPKTNRFRAVKPMTRYRQAHAAVLLQDGRVLVVGGWNGKKSHASAELFDPTTGQFTAVGDMKQARSGPTATLLRDGRVLVTGGWDAATGQSSPTAELFDPSTGQFEVTGSMSVAQSGHRAVLLHDGRVAIFGGNTAAVEIYDPTTGTFRRQGDMAVAPRVGGTANLLPNGKVLLVGGSYFDYPSVVARDAIEIYDSQSGTSRISGALTQGRYGHAAVTLADGRVLVVGGTSTQDGDPLRSTELVDPVIGKASPAAEMFEGREGAAGVLLTDGRVLILGGSTTDSRALASAELYTP